MVAGGLHMPHPKYPTEADSPTNSRTTLYSDFHLSMPPPDAPPYSARDSFSQQQTIADTRPAPAPPPADTPSKKSKSRPLSKKWCCFYTVVALLGFLVLCVIAAVIVVGRLPTMEKNNVSIVSVDTPNDLATLTSPSSVITIQIGLQVDGQITSYSLVSYYVDRLNVSIASASEAPAEGGQRSIGSTVGSGILQQPIKINANTATGISLPVNLAIKGNINDPVVAGVLHACGVYGSDRPPLLLHYAAYVDVFFLHNIMAREDFINVDCPLDTNLLGGVLDGIKSGVDFGKGLFGNLPDPVKEALPGVITGDIPNAVPGDVASTVPDVVNGGAGVVQDKTGVDPGSVVGAVPDIFGGF